MFSAKNVWWTFLSWYFLMFYCFIVECFILMLQVMRMLQIHCCVLDIKHQSVVDFTESFLCSIALGYLGLANSMFFGLILINPAVEMIFPYFPCTFQNFLNKSNWEVWLHFCSQCTLHNHFTKKIFSNKTRLNIEAFSIQRRLSFFKILSLCFKNIAYVDRNGRIFQELRDFTKYCKLWI